MPSHFYTTDSDTNKFINEGLIPEGIACYVFPAGIFKGLGPRVPFYHWRSFVGDNFYTRDETGELAPQAGYVYKGPACYVYADQQPNTVELYRWVHPVRGDHFYALAAEPELIVEHYQSEGVACYVFADEQPGTVAFFRFYDPHVNVL